MRQAAVGVALVMFAAAEVGSAYAQTPNQQGLPPREQVQLPKPQPAAPGRARVRVDSTRSLPAAPCPLERYDLQVTLTRIDFVSADGKPIAPEIAERLQPIAAAPPGGSNPVSVVCSIRDRATAALREAGYVATVQIPPQRIEAGVLTLQVVTAHIVEVRVRGDAGPYQRTLAARIAKLKSLDPLRERDAERILLLADDVPGLDVQLALRPAGREPGAVIGDLTIVFRRGAVLANVQNYGSRQLGRETGYARAEVYGLTGLSDLTYIGGQITAQPREQQVLQAGELVGIGSSGATLALGGTYAWSRPDLGELDLRANSFIGSITLQAPPLIRSVRTNLFASAGIDIVEQRTKVYASDSGGAPLNRDRLRTAFVRVTGSTRRPLRDGSDAYSLAGRVEVRRGLGILGATEPRTISSGGYTPSRFEGSAVATVVQGDLDAVVGLGPHFAVAWMGRGQWSDRPLLSYDEYSIGNLTIGRGYDPGSNSGDRLIGMRAELRAHATIKSRARAELFGFFDDIRLYNLDAAAIENDRRLRSLGGGLRVSLPGLLAVELIYAHALDPALLLPGVTPPDDRVLLSITTRFMAGGV